jgi:hypothetical protein
MARLRRQATTCGPLPVRSCEASSAKVTSRTQCRPFSIAQQRREGGHLAWRAVGLALGQHGTGGVIHRGQQVDLPAVASGAAQCLAVDRDRTSTLAGTVTVSQPCADHGGQQVRVHPDEGPADGGLGRHHPAVGGIAACTERGADRLGGVGGPLGDRGDRRAPVRAAAAAMARIATSGWRRPLGLRGSPIVAR